MQLRRPEARPPRRAGGVFLFVWLLLVSLSAALPPAVAADPTPAPVASDKEIDDLVTTLQDPAARDKLIQQLKALKAAQAHQTQTVTPNGLGAVLLAALSEQVGKISDAFVSTATAVLNLPQGVAWVAQQASDPTVQDYWIEVTLKILVVLLVSLAAEMLTARLLARAHRTLEARRADRLWLRLSLTVVRLVLELIPIIVFAVVAHGIVLPATHPSYTTRLVAIAIINANVLARGIVAVARALLSPKSAGLRLWPFGDETANYILIWVRRLTALSVYGYFLAEAALLLGLPQPAYEILLRVIGLLVFAMIVVVIMQNRTAVKQWITGNGNGAALSGLRQRLADVWHILAIVYVFATYVVWALDIEGGFEFLLRATVLTLIVLGLRRLVTTALHRLVERGFALSAELKARFPGLETRANRYLPFLQMLLQGVIYLFTILALLEIWGLHAFDWLASDFGRRILGSLVTIAVILLVALLLSEVVNEAVERLLARGRPRWRDAVQSARMRTLLPLLRNAFRVVLIVMVSLIVLSELGLNIAPLLAGAGVVGLAIGFGAQTLVKDVITGIFILAEDTIAVGDVVDLGGPTGVVEAMSIRSIRLRDLSGTVHTVPFSAVTTVKNMTKDYSYAVFEIGIAYSVPLSQAVGVVQEIGGELQKDRVYGRDIREPLEMLGISRFTDTSVFLRARMKTAPGRQWAVESAFNERLKRRFDELGIVRAFALAAAPVPTPQPAPAPAT